MSKKVIKNLLIKSTIGLGLATPLVGFAISSKEGNTNENINAELAYIRKGNLLGNYPIFDFSLNYEQYKEAFDFYYNPSQENIAKLEAEVEIIKQKMEQFKEYVKQMFEGEKFPEDKFEKGISNKLLSKLEKAMNSIKQGKDLKSNYPSAVLDAIVCNNFLDLFIGDSQKVLNSFSEALEFNEKNPDTTFSIKDFINLANKKSNSAIVNKQDILGLIFQNFWLYSSNSTNLAFKPTDRSFKKMEQNAEITNKTFWDNLLKQEITAKSPIIIDYFSGLLYSEVANKISHILISSYKKPQVVNENIQPIIDKIREFELISVEKDITEDSPKAQIIIYSIQSVMTAFVVYMINEWYQNDFKNEIIDSNNYKYSNKSIKVNTIDKINGKFIYVFNEDNWAESFSSVDSKINNRKIEDTKDLNGQAVYDKVMNDCPNLSEKQKEQILKSIENASDDEAYDKIINNIINVDNKTKEIKETLDKIPNIKNDKNYEFSSDLNKTQFNNEFGALINGSMTPEDYLGSIVDLTDLDNKLTEINNTISKLDGNSRYNELLDKNIKKIDEFKNLTPTQASELINNLKNASSEQEMAEIIAKASNLSALINQLTNAISKATEVKESNNYKKSDENNKESLDSSFKKVNDLLDEVKKWTMIDDSIVNNKILPGITELDNAIKSLNGDQKQAEKKNKIKEAIENEPALSRGQKDYYKSLITDESSDEDDLKNSSAAHNLNTLIQETNKKIDDANALKNTNNYNWASTDNKTAFDQAVIDIQNALKDQIWKSIIGNRNNEAEYNRTINEKVTNLQTATNNLDGEERLNNLVKNAVEKISKMQYLSDNYKAQVAKALKDVANESDIAQITSKAANTNTYAENIAKAIEDNPQIFNNTDGFVFSNAKQEVLNKLKGRISAEITDNKVNSYDSTEQDIEDISRAVSAAVTELNAEINQYKELKNTLIQQVQNDKDINELQKASLLSSFNQANSLEEIQTLSGQYTDLKNSMKELKNIISQIAQIKNTIKYELSDSSYKNNLDELLNKYKASEINTLSADTINTYIDNIKRASGNLNGDKNFEQRKLQARNKVSAYKYISPARKKYIYSQIDACNSVLDLNNLVNEVDKLELAANGLNSELVKSQLSKIKDLPKYIYSSESLKETYSETYKRSEALLANQSTDPATEFTIQDIDSIISDLNAAKSDISAAVNSLNGDLNWSNIKQEYILKINDLKHLNEITKNSYIIKINNWEQTKTEKDLESIYKSAEADSNAISKLEDVISSAKKLKESDNYKYVDNDDANVLNNLLSEYDTYIQNTLYDITQTQNNNSKLSSLITHIKTYIDAFATQVADSIKTINDLKNATDNLKAEWIKQINDSRVLQQINDIVANAQKIDVAIAKVVEANNQAKLITPDAIAYKYATPESKTEFDSQYSVVKDLIRNQYANKSEIEIIDAAQKLTYAIGQLNGQSQVDNIKGEAKSAISNLQNLTPEQKHNLISTIENESNPNEIDNIKNLATQLDAALHQAKELKQKVDKVINPNDPELNFSQADDDKKIALEQANTNLENQITSALEIKQLTTENLPGLISNLNAKTTTDQNELGKLNGDANYQAAISKAKDAINNAQYLSQGKKEQLLAELNNYKTVAQINALATNAKTLDDKTKEVALLASQVKELTQASNYSQVTKASKDNVTNALNSYNSLTQDDKLIVDKTLANIQSVLDELIKAKNSIQSDIAALEQAKKQASDSLDLKSKYPYLSNAQVQQIKAQINAVNSIEEIAPILGNATLLNKAMESLDEAIKQANAVKNTIKHTQATPSAKEAFDAAVDTQKMQELALQNQNSIVPSEIEAKANALSSVIQQLDGIARVQAAREEVINKINQAAKINDINKPNYISHVKQLNSINEINDFGALIDKYDQALVDLSKYTASSINAIKKTPRYLNSDEDKRNSFDAAAKMLQYESIVEFNQYIAANNISYKISVINDAINSYKKADKALNGLEKLDSAKQQAINDLGKLNYLSQELIDSYKTKINQANLIADVEPLISKARNENTAAGDLIQTIDQVKKLQKSAEYNLATEEQKKTLISALQAANNLLINETKVKDHELNIDNKTALEQAEKQLQDAMRNIKALAEEIIQEQEKAKGEIEQQSNLTAEQKTAAKEKINSATTSEKINEVVTNAKDLNQAMQDLSNALANAKRLKNNNDNNYKYASNQPKTNFDQVITKVENAIAQGLKDASKADIDKLIKEITSAQNSLDGNKNYNDIKVEIQSLKYLPTFKDYLARSLDNLANANDLQQAQKVANAAKFIDKVAYVNSVYKTNEPKIAFANQNMKQELLDLINSQRVEELFNAYLTTTQADYDSYNANLINKLNNLNGLENLANAKRILDSLDNLCCGKKALVEQIIDVSNPKFDATYNATFNGEVINNKKALDKMMDTLTKYNTLFGKLNGIKQIANDIDIRLAQYETYQYLLPFEVKNIANILQVTDPENSLQKLITKINGLIDSNDLANLNANDFNTQVNNLIQTVSKINVEAFNLASMSINKLDSTIYFAKQLPNLSSTLSALVSQAETVIYQNRDNILKDKMPDVLKALQLSNQIFMLAKQSVLSNMIDSLPESLRNNEQFKADYLVDAKKLLDQDINNLTSSQLGDFVKNIQTEITKLTDVNNKSDLYQAIKQASEALNPTSELQAALQKAKEVAANSKNNFNVNLINTTTKELINATLKSQLNDLVNEAEKITTKSNELETALNTAKTVLNKNASNQELEKATNDLSDALIKNHLAQLITQAKNLLPKLDTQALILDKNQLTSAISNAEAINNASVSEAEPVHNAYNVLKEKFDTALNAFNGLIKTLNDTVTKAKALSKADSMLAKQIPNDATVHDLITNQSASAIIQATDKLQHFINVIPLENYLESPELNPNIKLVAPFTILKESTKAKYEDLNFNNLELIQKQAQLQALNNVIIKNLNNTNDLANLNQAQKEALEAKLQACTNEEQANVIAQEAISLDKSMLALKQQYQALPSSLKDFSDPIFAAASPDKQVAFKQALTDASNILATPGVIYQTNAASEIDSLAAKIKTALEDLKASAQANNKVKKELEENTNNAIENYKDLINSNKFNNAPTQLQNEFKQVLEDLKQQHQSIVNTAGPIPQQQAAKIEKLLDQIKTKAKEINLFPAQQYSNTSGTIIPEIQDWIEKNLTTLSDQDKAKVANEFNSTNTYQAAQAVKDKALKQYNDNQKAIAQVVDKILEDIANNKISEETQKEIDKVAPILSSNQANDFKHLAESLISLQALAKALKQYQETDVKDTNLLENNTAVLNKAIANYHPFKASSIVGIKPVNAINAQAARLIANANALKAMVSALQNKDAQQFASTNVNNNELENNIVNFAQLIKQSPYFETINNLSPSRSAIKDLVMLFSDPNFTQAPNVLQSAAKANVKANTQAFPWWAYLVIIASVLFISGIVIYIKDKK
ncbi:hypothetical protein ACNQ2B_00465 [Mycoplasma sp. Z707]|uniref:hypothetical protein n=1 Tax=Mycoplasma sp. Z707 TaxID=3401691 RepID=UPI003AAD596B